MEALALITRRAPRDDMALFICVPVHAIRVVLQVHWNIPRTVRRAITTGYIYRWMIQFPHQHASVAEFR